MTSTWKHTELRICRLLGMERNGAQGAEGPDCDCDWLAVEVKHRARVPKFLTQTLAKVRRQAGADRLGIMVLHEHGSAGDDDLVIMALSDFADWYGGGSDDRPTAGA